MGFNQALVQQGHEGEKRVRCCGAEAAVVFRDLEAALYPKQASSPRDEAPGALAGARGLLGASLTVFGSR